MKARALALALVSSLVATRADADPTSFGNGGVAPSPAPVPIDRWTPSTGRDGIANVEGVPDRGAPVVSAWGAFGRRMLIADNGARTTDVITTVGTTHVAADVALRPWLRVVAGARATAWVEGDHDARTNLDPTIANGSQVRVGLRARLTPEGRAWGFAVSLWGAAAFPSAAVSGELAAVFAGGTGPFRYAFNLGTRLDPRVVMLNHITGPTAFARAALRFAATPALATWLTASFATGITDETLLLPTENLSEITAGVDLEFLPGAVLSAGGGAGLTQGVGSPTARAMLGLRWTLPVTQHTPERDTPLAPAPVARAAQTPTLLDRDHDGIPDARDACVTLPEDRDGVLDHDGCPDPDPPQRDGC